MPSIRRIVRLVAGALATLLHVWYRAVLAAPEVKRRKAARRAARAADGHSGHQPGV